MPDQVPIVVAANWLARNLNEPGLKVITSESMTVTATGSSQAAVARDVRAEFEAAHIPGTALSNFDEFSDPTNPLLMMLPSKEQFAAQVG